MRAGRVGFVGLCRPAACRSVGWVASRNRIHCNSPRPPSTSHRHPPPPSAREALRQCLPELLRNPGFTACLKSDDTTRRWLAQLLVNVGFPEAAAQLSNEMLQPTPLQGQ